MEDTSTDAPTGITLLGSEMLTWSDFGGAIGPVRGRIAGLLLHGFGGARSRALVAGPHDASVVAEVASQFEQTDVLVRSLEDAQALRAELPAAVHVFCGPLDRLAPRVERYDAVIALDGLDRLHSAEEEQPAWSGTLSQLTGLVGEGGEIYLGIGNEAGVDRLLTLGPEQRHDDANWPAAHLTADDVPLGLDEITEHLAAAHGLARVEAWACYGERAEPLLAAPVRLFSDHRRDPRLGALVDRAAHRAVGGLVPVKDAGHTARVLLRHGIGAEVAPLWVLHYRADSSAREETPTDVVLLAEPESAVGVPAVAARIQVGQEWVRETVGEGAVGPLAAGVTRDLGLLAGPLPSGELLQARLSALCAAQDLSEVSVLVRRYHDWLGSGPVPVEKVPVTFAGLVDTGTTLVPLDPSYRATEPAPAADVLIRTLLVAARDLLSSGLRHPWPVSWTPRQVAGALVAATGIELSDAQVARAEELDARLTAPEVVVHRGRADEPEELEADAAAGVTVEEDEAAAVAEEQLADEPQPALRGASPASYAEAIELLESHRVRAAELEAQIQWLIVSIHQRQRANKFVRAQVAALRNSPEFQTGRRVLWLRTLTKKSQTAWQKRVRSTPAAGEWVPPSGKERQPIELDAELLPPGYQAKDHTI